MPAAGLTSAEVKERRRSFGPNELQGEPPIPAWRRFATQLGSPLIGLLLAAAVAALLMGERADAIAIGVIVAVNAVVGFRQEARAERAIAALRGMTAPRARVLRDGQQSLIAAAEVVPGDAVLVEAGDIVAADGRLETAHALQANEAPLTGESEAISKSADDQGPAGQLFMGTSVTSGTGLMRVTATGMSTQLGKIARLIQTATIQATPLQQRLARVGRALLLLCGGAVALTALLGLLRGRPLFEVFISAVSLAVAAVPEGLPAVVTIALAIGVQRMAARQVLVRRLPAVETLGSVTVICTDKTGTLTTSVMAVRELWGADHGAVIAAAAACCDAQLGVGGRGGTGDPTELAILAEAFDRGLLREHLEEENPRRVVHPFDGARRRMSIQRADGVLYVKGAFESVAPLCAPATLGDAARATTEMSRRGYRVLAVATGAGPDERDLNLLGVIGLADPPRSEAIEAVAAAHAAGIRTVMITGDHRETARAIAREMGIARPGDDVEQVVHARATPEDKLRIVRQWKQEGAVVAMTGDGVNDAPALREAHVGIAMGRTGTEVTRAAADLVLADDNFASIIAAVREGRGIFDNIRKTLVYLLAGNTGELLLMLGAAAIGLPPPLLPLQLLWINLVTDGLPALALVMDPADPQVMNQPPRAPSQPLLGRAEWTNIAITGLLQAALALAVFAWRAHQGDLPGARSLAFSTLIFGELFRAFASRSPSRVLWEVGAFSNLRLVLVVGASLLAQLGLHALPPLQRLFGVTDLGAADLTLAVALGLVPVSVLEMGKLVRRCVRRRPARAVS